MYIYNKNKMVPYQIKLNEIKLNKHKTTSIKNKVDDYAKVINFIFS